MKTLTVIVAGIYFALLIRGQAAPVVNPGENGTTTGQSIPTFGGTGGQIRILSGTGSFDSVSDANNILHVSPGAELNGTVMLKALNLGPGGAVAPLIYTPSWGEPSNSWHLINRWIRSGQSEQEAQISLTAPTAPGVYHIIFAAGWVMTGGQVASGTSQSVGRDIWGDGNDMAEFKVAQLASAQANGWAFTSWLNGPDSEHAALWYLPERPIPADAITVTVTGGSGLTRNEGGSGINRQETVAQSSSEASSGSVLRYTITGMGILLLAAMAAIIFKMVLSPRKHG